MLHPVSVKELYFKNPRDYIIFEHELRKARRPSYSMRAFARDLSISPSSLNDFLKERVGMSEERIESIARFLNWSLDRKEHFRDLIGAQFDRDPAVRKLALLRTRKRLKSDSYNLSLEAFKVISDWYHLAILELCGLKNHLSALQIAQDLHLTTPVAQKAIARLIKLNLLVETAEGLKPETDISHFGDEGFSEAIKTFHTQVMDLAKVALQNNSAPENDSQTLFYSVEQKELPQMNAEIRKAVLDIINRYAETKKADCVQALSLQLFPIWVPKPGELQ